MYNKAILVGRLTADPELKQTPSGVSVCTFSVACDRSYSSKGSEKQVDFLDIVAWRERAEFVTKYFSKGKGILIEGEIQTRTYKDKNGNNRKVWEIVADQVRFYGSKNENGGGKPSADVVPAPYEPGGAGDFAEIDDDGDLPF